MSLAAGAVLAAGGAGFGLAWQLQAGNIARAEIQRRDIDAETRRMQRQAADSAATRHERERERIAAQRRVITRRVEHVIAANAAVAAAVCLDDDGLRLVTEAASGQPSAAQPEPALPASAAAR